MVRVPDLVPALRVPAVHHTDSMGASTTREKGFVSPSHRRRDSGTFVRQGKLGAFDRVKVPVGQGLTSHPYRVLRRNW